MRIITIVDTCATKNRFIDSKCAEILCSTLEIELQHTTK